MIDWGRAGASIHAAFAELEPIVYTTGGVALPPIRAVRAEEPAPEYSGAGNSLRKITYELRQVDLPEEPSKKDSFTHRGRRWRILDVTRADDVGAWQLVVADAGAAL